MAEGKSIRKPISKKVRFEVFKRDSFCCQYCSAKPPHVPLEVDHILPVSKGGKNNIDNLITACFDCNRGKSDNTLDSVSNPLIERTERKKIALKQYKEYLKIIESEEAIINGQINAIEDVFCSVFEDYSLTEKFKLSIKKFIEQLGFIETKKSMEYACSKMRRQDQAVKYFCGVCWGKIRENG